MDSSWNPYTIQMEYIECDECVKPFLTLQKCMILRLPAYYLPCIGAVNGDGTAYRANPFDLDAGSRLGERKRKLNWDWIGRNVAVAG